MHPTRSFGALWAEDLPLDDVHRALPALAARGLALHLAWRHGEDDADRLALAAEARAAGVSIRPWLLLPAAQGYWAGALNAPQYAAAAREMMARWVGSGLPPTIWIVDMEPPKARLLALESLLQTGIRGAPSLLRALKAQALADLAPAAIVYSELVEEARRQGWLPWLTTLPMVADDLASGRQTFCRWLGLPVKGPQWGVVSLQVYRTMFDDALPGPLSRVGVGPGLVTRYARLARAAFGARAALDLGLIGGGVVPGAGVYPDVSGLAADVAAARRGGIPAERLSIFSLEGALARPPLDRWLDVSHGPGARPGVRAHAVGALLRGLSLLGGQAPSGRSSAG